MKIFPAIDLSEGKVVRLYKGDYDKQTVYCEDAVSVAEGFYKQGARYLHIVDLDGAKSGRTENGRLIEKIVSATGMFCEVGGGIRTEESIGMYLSHGAARVILGTAAVKDPAFLKASVEKHGEKVAVGVDTKNGRVAVKGWTETTDISGVDYCVKLRDMGVKHVIYTDISRDGTLKGANLALYKELAGIEGLTVTASGGVTYLDELLALDGYGIDSAILGKALYEGVLDLSEALRALEGAG